MSVIIKKKGLGLNSITSEGGNITPRLFDQDTKDRGSNGVPRGEYKGHTLPGSRQYLSPKWNDLKRQWCWGGTPEDLAEMIKKLRLKYPKNHPFSGQFISNDKTAAVDRLRDYNDDFFNHVGLYGKVFMEDGKVALDDESTTMHKFLYLCYLGDHNVDKRDKDANSFLSAGADLEMLSPQAIVVEKAGAVDRDLDAMSLLNAMKTNEDRMRAIAEIMKLAGYSSSTETNGVLILLKDQAALNRETNRRFGKNQTYQDRFINLANLSDADLSIERTILLGKNKGKIRAGKNYIFQGEKLEGVHNDISLIKYFRNPDNQEKYLDLIDLLEK